MKYKNWVFFLFLLIYKEKIQSEGKFKMIFLSLYIDISYVVVFKLYKSLNSQNSNYLRQFESFLCENDFHLNSSQLLVRRNRFIKAPHRPSFPLQISLDMASRKAKPSPQNSKENYLFFHTIYLLPTLHIGCLSLLHNIQAVCVCRLIENWSDFLCLLDSLILQLMQKSRG